MRVSEAISFNYHQKHPRHKNLYQVQGKGNKTRYVYVSPQVISELKSSNWKPNQTNRFNFYNFLQKTKQELNINPKIELTPHTLRRVWTTYHAEKGIPMPVLQKVLGHENIRTTAYYWKGSVDIREFEGWLEPLNDQLVPGEKNPQAKIKSNSYFPKLPEISIKLENPLPNNTKKLKLSETISKIKQKDQQLIDYRQKLDDLSTKNNSLIQNYTKLRNNTKNPRRKTQKTEINLKPLNFSTINDKKIKKPNKIILNKKKSFKNHTKNNLVIKKHTELNNSIQNKHISLVNSNQALNSVPKLNGKPKERKIPIIKASEPVKQNHFSKKEKILLNRIRNLKKQLEQVRTENTHLKLENKHLKVLVKQDHETKILQPLPFEIK